MSEVSAATAQRVLDVLVREADLDGLVTVSTLDIGRAVGLTRRSVGVAVHALEAEGKLRIIKFTPGRGATTEIQLDEAVLA